MKLDVKNYQGYALLLLAQLMVGVCIVGSKSLLQTLPAITILMVRFIIGFLFLLFFHFIFSKEKFRPLKKLSRLDWLVIIAQALCAGAFFNILLLLGLQYTSASVAGIITSALPAIVVIFSILFLKERITLATSLCIVFAVLGLVIINASSLRSEHANHFFGDLLILASLLPEAGYYVLSKYRHNKLPVFLVSALMNGINIPVFLLILLFHHQAFPAQLLLQHFLLLAIVGIGSALFYVFWFLGCKSVHGSSAGLTTAFMPIATLIIAWLCLNEAISILQVCGMMLVIVSIVFNVSK